MDSTDQQFRFSPDSSSPSPRPNKRASYHPGTLVNPYGGANSQYNHASLPPGGAQPSSSSSQHHNRRGSPSSSSPRERRHKSTSFVPSPTQRSEAPSLSAGTPGRDRTSNGTMPQYQSRDVGESSQGRRTKQSVSDLKLRRLTELNNRLREDLDRERIPVSQAAKSIIAYCNSTRDYMVPSVWGAVPKADDPYAPQQSGGCCLVM